MLDIFKNETLNKRANEYFLMFFNVKDDEIESYGYKEVFMDIFPEHLVHAELKKCKKIYREIYSWIVDEFLHNDFRPIHQYVLHNLLGIQKEIEEDLRKDKDFENEKDEELESLRKNISEEEIEYLDNIENAEFYLDFLFEDNDFLYYKLYYDCFGTEVYNFMRYDDRIIELLPRDKRKELKHRMKLKCENNVFSGLHNYQ